MTKNIITETKIGNKIWIDITNPTRKKLMEYQSKYKIHDADIQTALDDIIIPKTFEHKNYLFIAIHASHLNQDNQMVLQEIDFLFSKNFIITIHNQPVDFFANICEEIYPETSCHNTAHVLFRILKKITVDHYELIKFFAQQINQLEIDLAAKKNDEKPVITQILSIRKNLLSMINISEPNIAVIKEIHSSAILKNYFQNYLVYFDSLIESQQKSHNMIKHYIDIINGLIDTVNILVNNRFNEIIRTLTIVSVSLMPLTLIAGILGMNFKSIIFDIPFGFEITIIFMILLEIFIIQYFIYKKWL